MKYCFEDKLGLGKYVAIKNTQIHKKSQSWCISHASVPFTQSPHSLQGTNQRFWGRDFKEIEKNLSALPKELGFRGHCEPPERVLGKALEAPAIRRYLRLTFIRRGKGREQDKEGRRENLNGMNVTSHRIQLPLSSILLFCPMTLL